MAIIEHYTIPHKSYTKSLPRSFSLRINLTWLTHLLVINRPNYKWWWWGDIIFILFVDEVNLNKTIESFKSNEVSERYIDRQNERLVF